MFSFFRSVVSVFVAVSVLGTTSATADSFGSMAKKSAGRVAKVVGYIPDEGNVSSVKKAAKVAVSIAVEAVAVPTAVAGASAMGVTATTGTTIATLSGAAATNATLYAIGAPIASALTPVATALGATVAAPAVVGGIVVGGAAMLIGWGVSSLIDDE